MTTTQQIAIALAAFLVGCSPDAVISDQSSKRDTVFVSQPDQETATVYDQCKGAQIDWAETYQLVKIDLSSQDAPPISEMRHKMVIAGTEYNFSDSEAFVAEVDPEKVCREHGLTISPH